MARRKMEEHHIRNLTKIAGGSSYAITLPIDVVRALGWKSKQKLVVERHEDGILIRDWEK